MDTTPGDALVTIPVAEYRALAAAASTAVTMFLEIPIEESGRAAADQDLLARFIVNGLATCRQASSDQAAVDLVPVLAAAIERAGHLCRADLAAAAAEAAGDPVADAVTH